MKKVRSFWIPLSLSALSALGSQTAPECSENAKGKSAELAKKLRSLDLKNQKPKLADSRPCMSIKRDKS